MAIETVISTIVKPGPRLRCQRGRVIAHRTHAASVGAAGRRGSRVLVRASSATLIGVGPEKPDRCRSIDRPADTRPPERQERKSEPLARTNEASDLHPKTPTPYSVPPARCNPVALPTELSTVPDGHRLIRELPGPPVSPNYHSVGWDPKDKPFCNTFQGSARDSCYTRRRTSLSTLAQLQNAKVTDA